MINCANSKLHVDDFIKVLDDHDLAHPKYALITHWYWDQPLACMLLRGEVRLILYKMKEYVELLKNLSFTTYIPGHEARESFLRAFPLSLYPPCELQDRYFCGVRFGLCSFTPLFRRFTHKLGETSIEAGNGLKSDLFGDGEYGSVRAF